MENGGKMWQRVFVGAYDGAQVARSIREATDYQCDGVDDQVEINAALARDDDEGRN